MSRAVELWTGKTDDTPAPPRVRQYISSLTIDDILDRAMVDMNSGCWLWERGSESSGYGSWPIPAKISGIGKIRSHRMSYQIAYGAIESEDLVCHKCDTPACVNPQHLFLGTQADNMGDCARKKRVRTPMLSGENHPGAKLNASDVVAIRNDSRSLRKIANDYGISASTLSEIKRRTIWRSVP